MVANAGIAVTASLPETTAEQWQRTPNVNVTGVAHCYSATAERHPARIRDGGHGRRDPAGTSGDSQDVAGVVSFLASPDAGYVTGQSIVVDGGMWLT
jgi:NAD(P)-dependent dehydrogenase (short-subunit alcohol dehydrogenase family)